MSGLAGVSAGFALVAYEFLLADDFLYGGVQTAPGWLETVQIMLLLGSIAVLVYASMVDEVFRGWLDVVTGLAVIAQWGLPASLYLDGIGGPGNVFGLLVVVCAAAHVLVGIVFTINYGRWARRE